MPYKVINNFHDAEDNNRLYREGDEFPNGDSKPSKKRIDELSKKHPDHGVAFIEEVKTKSKKDKD